MNSSVSSGRICFRNQNFCFRTASTPCARFMFLVQCTYSKLYKGSVRDGVYQDFIVIMYSMCVCSCACHIHTRPCMPLDVYIYWCMPLWACEHQDFSAPPKWRRIPKPRVSSTFDSGAKRVRLNTRIARVTWATLVKPTWMDWKCIQPAMLHPSQHEQQQPWFQSQIGICLLYKEHFSATQHLWVESWRIKQSSPTKWVYYMQFVLK